MIFSWEIELTRKRPFNVSLRCLSTALWVARRSAVLARRDGLRLGGPLVEALALAPLLLELEALPVVDDFLMREKRIDDPHQATKGKCY